MTREGIRGSSRSSPRAFANRRAILPTPEPLESRALLSRAWPVPIARPNVRLIGFQHSVYEVRIQGPGVVTTAKLPNGQAQIRLFGTTAASTVRITPRRLDPHQFEGGGLPIGRIEVRSGQLGAIEARQVGDLLGPITPLTNDVRALHFRTIGRDARIEVANRLRDLSADAIDLGPNGIIRVGGDLTGRVDVRRLVLDGGQFLVGGDLSGSIVAGSLRAEDNGRLVAARDINNITVRNDAVMVSGGGITTGQDLGNLRVRGDLTVGVRGRIEVGRSLCGSLGTGGNLDLTGGRVSITDDLGNVVVGNDLTIVGGGQLLVGDDVTGSITVAQDTLLEGNPNQAGRERRLRIGRDVRGEIQMGGSLTLRDGATLEIGRDVLEPWSIGGDLVVSDDALLRVGRGLAALEVTGDIDTSGGGQIIIGGNVGSLEVGGAIVGDGDRDITVGLSLNGLAVLGGRPDQGSINNVDLAIAKNLIGIDVRHGVFNSFITAGVLIDGRRPGGGAGVIGPDGPAAVVDSEIRAGVQIRNLILNGDVVRRWQTNPSGRRTRILAGVNRAGRYTPGGVIANFRILGALIDAVVAASVRPSGGDGNLDPNGPLTPSAGTYDAPAGTLATGTIGNVTNAPHFAPGTYNEFGQLVGYFYNNTLSPTVDDCLLPGSINAGFAPTPLASNPPPTDGTPIPLPLASTVLGGVIDTVPAGSTFDHAGIFAADTRGVFVGVLPTS